jgi:putative flippase GtrA
MVIFLKWCLVAGTTFTIDFVSFYVLAKTLNQIVFANIIAFIVSTVANYSLHKNWTFVNRPSPRNSLVRYSVYICLNLVLSSLTLTLFCDLTESLSQGKIYNSLLWLPINFLVMKVHAFDGKKPSKK